MINKNHGMDTSHTFVGAPGLPGTGRGGHHKSMTTHTLISLHTAASSSIALSFALRTTRRSSSDSESDDPIKKRLAPPSSLSSEDSVSEDSYSDPDSDVVSSSEVVNSSLSSSLSLPRPQNFDACIQGWTHEQSSLLPAARFGWQSQRSGCFPIVVSTHTKTDMHRP